MGMQLDRESIAFTLRWISSFQPPTQPATGAENAPEGTKDTVSVSFSWSFCVLCLCLFLRLRLRLVSCVLYLASVSVSVSVSVPCVLCLCLWKQMYRWCRFVVCM